MKKTLLGMLFVAAFGMAAFGQTTFADFEGLDMTFGGWDGATFAIVDNPLVDGDNGSAKVAEFANAGTLYAGIYQTSGLGGDIDYSTSTTFTVDVYADTAGTVAMKLENNADNTDSQEIILDYDTPGAWKTLTFDMDQLAASVGKYNKFVFIFDHNLVEPYHIWYFDNIVGPGFIAGGDVDVSFQVTDLDNSATSVEAELSSDPGTKIALTNDGSGVWTSTAVTIPGSTFQTAIDYTYTLYVDGTALADQTDVDLDVFAGSDPMTVAYTFGGGLTDEALAAYFGLDWPTIDGLWDDAWDYATEYPVSLPFQTETFENEDDMNGSFRVGWDENGLYVLIETADDYFYPAGDFGEDWEKDKVELYLDTNLDNLADGFGPGDATDGNGGDNGHFQLAPAFLADWEPDKAWMTNGGVEWGWVSSSTTEGDAYTQITEFYIPWAAMPDVDGNTITPADDIEIGLGITFCDNDGADGGIARNRMVWVNASGPESWDVMDGCGTLMLDFTGVAVENNFNTQFRIYPNPAKDVINISNAIEVSSVTIRNILGAEVKHIITSGETLSINTSDLNSGIYIISLENETGVLSNSKFVVE